MGPRIVNRRGLTTCVFFVSRVPTVYAVQTLHAVQTEPRVPVRNVFDAGRYITLASGRGLGPGNGEFLGPVKWHRADR
jgi:hypothetical protein